MKRFQNIHTTAISSYYSRSTGSSTNISPNINIRGGHNNSSSIDLIDMPMAVTFLKRMKNHEIYNTRFFISTKNQNTPCDDIDDRKCSSRCPTCNTKCVVSAVNSNDTFYSSQIQNKKYRSKQMQHCWKTHIRNNNSTKQQYNGLQQYQQTQLLSAISSSSLCCYHKYNLLKNNTSKIIRINQFQYSSISILQQQHSNEKKSIITIPKAITDIKHNIQKLTVQGLKDAFQILHDIIPVLHHHHNHDNHHEDYHLYNENCNEWRQNMTSFDEFISIVNLALQYGRKVALNHNHNKGGDFTMHDLCHAALDLLQHIESFLKKDYYYQYQHNSTSTANNDDYNDNNHHHHLRKMYNLTIDILSKTKKIDNTSTIHEIISKMENAPQQWNIQPNEITYNSLLYSYAQRSHPHAAEETEAILRQMIQWDKPHDVISYNIVLNSWAKNKTHDKDPLTKTKTIKNSAERAEMLLHEMQRRYLDHGHVHVKPNVVSFTTLLDAFCNSSDLDAARKAADLLYTMEQLCDRDDDEHLRPNLFMYNTVLNVWSKSSLPGSAQCAHELLDKMIADCIQNDKGNNHSSGNGKNRVCVRPNTISFAICIKAHARGDEKGSSDKALALLKQMIDLSKNQGFNATPDVGTFNSVLRALNNDSKEDQVIKAENLLRQMKEMGLRPDLTTYNNILRCCCNTKTDNANLRRSAIRIATDTLLELKKSDGRLIPDPYTFNFFIKTCDRLTSGEEKIKLIRAAFTYCIQEGQFSKPVLSIMKNALKPNELCDILQLGRGSNLTDLKISDFPKAWSNNNTKK